MRRIGRFGCVILFLATAGAVPVVAQGKGQGKGQAESRGQSNADEERDVAQGNRFGSRHVKIIREFFLDKNNVKGLPPGLAKRDELPPGLRKHIQRNGTLPPGLQKRVQPFPRGLEILLPRLPDGRRRVIIGVDVILIDERSSLILDVVEGVLAGIELLR